MTSVVVLWRILQRSQSWHIFTCTREQWNPPEHKRSHQNLKQPTKTQQYQLEPIRIHHKPKQVTRAHQNPQEPIGIVFLPGRCCRWGRDGRESKMWPARVIVQTRSSSLWLQLTDHWSTGLNHQTSVGVAWGRHHSAAGTVLMRHFGSCFQTAMIWLRKSRHWSFNRISWGQHE